MGKCWNLNERKKHIKWVNTLLHHNMFILLRQKILLSRKHIKNKINTSITWKYFGSKLFWLLRWEHFLTGAVSSGFYHVYLHANSASSIQSDNELNINGKCAKMPVEASVTYLCCNIRSQNSILQWGFGFKQQYHVISETGIFLFIYWVIYSFAN